MQFPSDTALAAAIAAANVSIRPLLEVDWNRDKYATGAYRDLSKIVSKVDIDFASLHSDLPSEINAVVGSSSALMKVTLSGRRNTSELFASQLLSKYMVTSPLYPIAKEATPIRYSRVVKTTAGDKTIRQFTGWISEYDIDEASDTVTLTCSDVYDLQTKPVTLPLWARGPNYGPKGANGFLSPMNVIDVNWVYGEVLRQAGRPVWPTPRSDAIAYWSCAGSMIPSTGFGSLADADDLASAHAVAYTYGDSFLPFRPGKYDLATDYAGWNDNGDFTVGHCRSSRQCNVPNRGTSDPNTIYLGFSGWFFSTGVGGTSGGASSLMFVIGAGAGNGFLQLQVYPGGTVWISLFESPSSGSSNAGVTRTWKWDSAGANTMPLGWHWVECYMTFTVSVVTVGLRVDDVVKFPNAAGANSAGFMYTNNINVYELTNHCVAEARETYMQHVQIWHGFGTPPFASGVQQHPPYIAAGASPPALTTFTSNWLTHIPDRANKYAWDVLKESIEGELGVMFTREDGQLWMMDRDAVYAFGIGPPMGNDPGLYFGIGWFSKNSTTFPDDYEDMSRNKISGLVYNPSADIYRNTISYHVDQTKQIQAIVWESNDPKAFYAASGSTGLFKDIGLPSGTVSIYGKAIDTGASVNSNKPPLDQTSVSAIDANALTAIPSGWLATVFWQLNQRFFRFAYGAGILSLQHDLIGAFAGGNQANLQIGGYKYDNSDPYDGGMFITAEVAARGQITLDLGTNEWRQFPAKLDSICVSLLRDTVKAVPVVRNLSVPVDPRRQLLDVIKLPPSKIVSGDVFAQVVGKRLTDTQNSAQDQLDVRVVQGPVIPAFWDQALWDVGTWTL